jgi:serine O-acetyltransferase
MSHESRHGSRPGLNEGEMRDDDGISADTADWSRERCVGFWDPGPRLLRSIRSYQYWEKREIPWRWISKYWVFQHHLWSVITGADIPLNCDIGGGLRLVHPNGVVIFPGAVIGPNCQVFQQVTIGVGGSRPGAPVLGGHVDVGAGAKILGGVKIGDHALIGANAVVLRDVPPGATAVGVPARIILASTPDDQITREDKQLDDAR